jgi:uncharacterized protein
MLKQEIQEDLNKAIKGKNGEERSVLRLVLASILNKEKEKRYKIIKMEPNVSEEELKEKFALSDQEIIQLLFYEIKKRKEAVLEFKKGNRPELATQEENEVKILEKYLPEQISEEEIKRVVTQKIIETNASTLKDIGLVIKKTMAEVAGKAEAGIVGRIAKDLLSRQ